MWPLRVARAFPDAAAGAEAAAYVVRSIAGDTGDGWHGTVGDTGDGWDDTAGDTGAGWRDTAGDPEFVHTDGPTHVTGPAGNTGNTCAATLRTTPVVCSSSVGSRLIDKRFRPSSDGSSPPESSACTAASEPATTQRRC